MRYIRAVPTARQRWLFAVKPASWPKILMPACLGQAVGIFATGQVSLAALLVGIGFTMCDIVFIVLMNDWGDREVDTIKRRMFSERSSKKTIPDGILPSYQVLGGGLLAGALALLVALVGGLALGRPMFLPGAVVALAMFGAYTFGPRYNYRGGGELLEAAGVGIVMIWLHAYLQSGQLASGLLMAVLPGAFFMALASAFASGLGDEESDRAGGKRTFTTWFGNRVVRLGAQKLLFMGWGAWLLAGVLGPVPLWTVVLPAVFAWHHGRELAALSPRATTGELEILGAYKTSLHRAIWGSHALLALCLALGRHA